jgi:hypothetical protein
MNPTSHVGQDIRKNLAVLLNTHSLDSGLAGHDMVASPYSLVRVLRHLYGLAVRTKPLVRRTYIGA